MSFLDRIGAMVDAYERRRSDRRSLGESIDAALVAGAAKADEEAAQRQHDESLAASRAEVRESCERYGWWWPPR